MPRRLSFTSLLLAATLTMSLSASQEAPAPSGIRIVLPDGADLKDLSIEYQLTGAFGAFRTSLRSRADMREYLINARYDGQLATGLQVIVFCPGYRAVLLSESEFGSGSPKSVPVELEAQGWVPLNGRVSGAAANLPLEVEITYLPLWKLRFFRIFDGGLSWLPVASTVLRSDGSFAARVPDLASDPAVASYTGVDRPGYLRLSLRDSGNGNLRYLLEPQGSGPRLLGVPIAREYPSPLQLRAVAR